MEPPSARARGASRFRPRFTLTLLYVFLFTLLYGLVFVAPSLWQVWRTLPPGPAQQEAARDAAHAAVHLRLALFAAIGTTALGAWARVLPGLRG